MLGIGVKMFEQHSQLLGRHLEHCFLAFTQAQPLHEPVRLHLQHSTIFRDSYMVVDMFRMCGTTYDTYIYIYIYKKVPLASLEGGSLTLTPITFQNYHSYIYVAANITSNN